MGADIRADIETQETTASWPLTVVSVDVGGTKIAVATVVYKHEGGAPSIPWKIEVPTKAQRGGDVVLETIVEAVREGLSHAETPVAGIGVGTAGRVRREDGSIAYAVESIVTWDNPIASFSGIRSAGCRAGRCSGPRAGRGPLGRCSGC